MSGLCARIVGQGGTDVNGDYDGKENVADVVCVLGPCATMTMIWLGNKAIPRNPKERAGDGRKDIHTEWEAGGVKKSWDVGLM
jgi:hypothetical protein